MIAKDTGTYQSPQTIIQFMSHYRQTDYNGWLTTRKIQEECKVRRDVLLNILRRLYEQGTVEKCGVLGHKKFYRMKIS